MGEKSVKHAIAALVSNFFSRAGFKDAWHEPVLFVGAAAALFIDVVEDKFKWIPLVVAIGLLAIGTVRAYMVKVKTLDTETERDELREQLNYLESLDNVRRAYFGGAVKTTLRNMTAEIGVKNVHTRATIYVHNGTRFAPFGRVSDNPIHEKVGRGFYPEDQGVIANAWQSGSDVCTDLPGTEPTRSKRVHKDFKIPVSVSKAFRMKSKSLIGVRISDVVDETRGHIGVVIVESMNARGVNNTHVKRVVESKTWHVLQMQLSGSRDFLPDVAEAERRGF